MAGRSQRWLHRRGFTIIDLAIAVTIVAALVVLLIPALEGARAAATAGSCLNNQRQLGTAYQQYVADYSYLPGQNPWCYGTGAAVQEVDDPRFPSGPYYSTTVTIWADTAAENDPGFDGATGQQYTTTPWNPKGFKTIAVGHGALAMYTSTTATVAGANSNLFYCPGTAASFAPKDGEQPWYPTYWNTPASGQQNTFFDAYGGYWTGWAAFGAPTSYLSWLGANKPTNSAYGNVDNVCLSTYAWRGGEWTLNKNLPFSDTAGWQNNWTLNQRQTPSSPNVQQRVTLTCFWWNGYYSYGNATGGPGGNHPTNIPHDGKLVNNLWTDGHAASYKLPADQPVALWSWYDRFYNDGSLATFAPTDTAQIGGFYRQLPFWWALADQQAP